MFPDENVKVLARLSKYHSGTVFVLEFHDHFFHHDGIFIGLGRFVDDGNIRPALD